MPIRYIDQIKDLKGKKVFIRVDFNVPQDDKGNITEDTRIAGALPTIKYAVEQGAKVLFSPAAKTYLDMKYDSTTTLGLHWAGYVEVSDAYNWDPATLVEGIGRESVLGVEAPLWSETITNLDDIEYMVFPRLPGYAEIGWTPAAQRNWDEYKMRLANHAGRFEAMGIDYYKSPVVPWEK